MKTNRTIEKKNAVKMVCVKKTKKEHYGFLYKHKI